MTILATYIFLLLPLLRLQLLLLLLLLLKNRLPDSKTPWHGRTEKHENCTQKLPNVTSETSRNDDFGYIFLLLPLLRLQLLLLLLLLLKNRLPDSKTPWHGRTEKHENCAQKLPNVTSETGKKKRFWLHFPAAPATAAAAPTASALAAEKPAPGQQNTMARKDGEARKLHPKTP